MKFRVSIWYSITNPIAYGMIAIAIGAWLLGLISLVNPSVSEQEVKNMFKFGFDLLIYGGLFKIVIETYANIVMIRKTLEKRDKNTIN